MEKEQWKSPRKLQEESEQAYAQQVEDRRLLRLKVADALCDVVLDGLMTPAAAKGVYRGQFEEVRNNG